MPPPVYGSWFIVSGIAKQSAEKHEVICKKKKCLLIVPAVVAGIGYAVCVIWIIHDSVTGGPGRWHYLLAPTMCVLLCALNFYQYLKDEKSKK